MNQVPRLIHSVVGPVGNRRTDCQIRPARWLETIDTSTGPIANRSAGFQPALQSMTRRCTITPLAVRAHSVETKRRQEWRRGTHECVRHVVEPEQL